MSKGSQQRTEKSSPAHRSRCVGLCIVLLLSLSMLVVQGMPAHALVAGAQAQRASNFDARVDYNRTFAPAPGLEQQPVRARAHRLEQQRAIQELRDRAPGLGAT